MAQCRSAVSAPDYGRWEGRNGRVLRGEREDEVQQIIDTAKLVDMDELVGEAIDNLDEFDVDDLREQCSAVHSIGTPQNVDEINKAIATLQQVLVSPSFRFFQPLSDLLLLIFSVFGVILAVPGAFILAFVIIIAAIIVGISILVELLLLLPITLLVLGSVFPQSFLFDTECAKELIRCEEDRVVGNTIPSLMEMFASTDTGNSGGTSVAQP